MEQLVFSHRAALGVAVLALLFAFSNGFRDSATMVATLVSARVLAPLWAFVLCGLFEFAGALLIGSAIASTFSAGILGETLVKVPQDALLVIFSGLIVAIAWGAVCGWRSWPTSNNQALVAGFAGASWACCGDEPLRNMVLLKVTGVLIVTPLIGFLISTALTSALRFIGGWLTVRFRAWSDALHVLACLVVSSAHGSTNGQLVMAVVVAAIGLATSMTGFEPGQPVPPAVRVSVALAMSCGVWLGGRDLVRRMRMKFYRVRSLEGVGALASAAGTILAFGATGFPASTTQVVAGSIVGAGLAKNVKVVRWQIAREIVLSWLVTIPVVWVAAYLAAAVALRLRTALS